MDHAAAKLIKNNLENLYDLPFDVVQGEYYADKWFDIKPHNDGNELFTVRIKFKNQLRMVIEVTPEEYAAFSIKDMAEASIQKKKMFAEYAKQLNARRAKTDFFINGMACDVLDVDSWPDDWHDYRLRVTKSPICEEDENLNEGEIAASWSTIIIGMFLSLLDVTEKETDSYKEGGLSRVEVNRYERNPINRELCLFANGYSCKICGCDFEKIYGEIGHHFIHVHHIIPVSQHTEEYMIDPVNELIPVCPNCHAMLHRQNPPFFPDEIKEIIEKNK